jgi:hypothetical protein
MIHKKQYTQNLEFWICLTSGMVFLSWGALLCATHRNIWPVLAIPLAWYWADFSTAVAHWVCDNYGDQSKTRAVFRFRYHHYDARDMCSWSTVGNCQKPAEALAVPTFLGGLLLFFVAPDWLLPYAVAHLGVLLSNQFHAWSHDIRKDLPLVVHVLQRAGILLTKKHHSIHHRPNHEAAYGVVNGWSSPLLDGLKVFRGLEWVLSRSFGLESQKGRYDSSGVPDGR